MKVVQSGFEVIVRNQASDPYLFKIDVKLWYFQVYVFFVIKMFCL